MTCTEVKNKKFFEFKLQVQGGKTSVSITQGKAGTKGKTTKKSFASDEEARSFLMESIDEKALSGYKVPKGEIFLSTIPVHFLLILIILKYVQFRKNMNNQVRLLRTCR